MKSKRIDNGVENAQDSKFCLISIEFSKERISYLFLSSNNPANCQAHTHCQCHSIHLFCKNNTKWPRFKINKRSKYRNDIAQNNSVDQALAKNILESKVMKVTQQQKIVHGKQIAFIHLCDKHNSEVAPANMVGSFEFHLLFALFVGEFACIVNYGI